MFFSGSSVKESPFRFSVIGSLLGSSLMVLFKVLSDKVLFRILSDMLFLMFLSDRFLSWLLSPSWFLSPSVSKNDVLFYILFSKRRSHFTATLNLSSLIPQNGQTHSNNSSTVADELFECF